MAIQIKYILIEAINLIGLVERYYVSLRRAYLIITEKLKNQAFIRESRLQITIKAINNSAGYDDLISTLLIFGAFLRISNNNVSTLSIIKRAKAIRIAIAEVLKIHFKRQITNTLYQRNGPSTTRIHDIVIGSLVLVWRTHQKK